VTARRLQARHVLRSLFLAASLAAIVLGLQALCSKGEFDRAMALFGLGLAFLTLSALETWPSLQGTKTWPARLANGVRAHWVEMSLVSFLFLLAVFMRVYRYGVLPPANGIGFEEYQTGGVAHQIIHYGYRPYEFPLTGFLPAAAFALLGENTFALRLPFLILSIATFIPFYLLTRELFQRGIAIFVTALFAVSRWHSLVSRFADELFLPIFFETLLLYLLVKGSKTGKPIYFVGLGALTAYMAYAYSAYRIVPFLVLAYFALRCSLAFGKRCVSRRPHRLHELGQMGRRAALPLLMFAVAFVAIISPLALITMRGETLFTEALLRHDVAHEVPEPASLSAWLADSGGKVLRVMEALVTGDVGAPALNVPGTPLLEPVSAILFLTGVAYALLTFWRPYRALIAGWIVVSVVIGVVLPRNFYMGRFSALIPLIYLVIGFPLDDVWRFLKKKWPTLRSVYLVPVLVVLFAADAALNFHGLFVVHLNNPVVQQHYDNYLLAMCDRLNDLGDDIAVYGWSEREPLMFMFHTNDYSWACHDPDGAAMSNPFSVLPMRQFPRHQVAALAISQRYYTPEQLTAMAAMFYPDLAQSAVHIERPGGNYRVMVYTLTPEMVLKRHGLTGRYSIGSDASGGPAALTRIDPFGNGGWNGRDVPELSPDTPFEVRWSGLVYIPEEGTYGFQTETSARVQVLVDGYETYATNGSKADGLYLVRGWHVIEIHLKGQGQEETLQLLYSRDGETPRVIPREDLFAQASMQGLARTWQLEAGEQGKVSLRRIEPSILPVTVPSLLEEVKNSAPGARFLGEEWSGWLRVDRAGERSLRLNCWSGSAILQLDGQEALRCETPAHGYREVEQTLSLDAGNHPLVLTYSYLDGTLAGAQVYWKPPEGEMEPLLPDVLSPVRPAGKGTAALPPLPRPTRPAVPATEVPPPKPEATATPEPAPQAAPGTVAPAGQLQVLLRTDTTTLSIPRDLALHADGRCCVANPEARMVICVGGEGDDVQKIGERELEEPFDVGFDPQGRVLVLDSELGWVFRYSKDGRLEATLGKQAGMYHPRGMDVGSDGTIYVAATGSSRVVALDPKGEVRQVFGRPGEGPGELDQPTDVAAGLEGEVYVVDALLNRRIQVFAADGTFLRQWTLDWADRFESPRIAVGKDGTVYLSDPRGSRVVAYSPEGQVLAQWTNPEAWRRLVGLALGPDGVAAVTDGDTGQVYTFQLE